MTKYALLLKGGLPTKELNQDYLRRFVEWAGKASPGKQLEGNRFKQEGKVVGGRGAVRISDMVFGGDTVGGYIIIDAKTTMMQ